VTRLPTNHDLAGLLKSQSDLSTLLELVGLIDGLAGTLTSSSNITIFAPNKRTAFGAGCRHRKSPANAGPAADRSALELGQVPGSFSLLNLYAPRDNELSYLLNTNINIHITYVPLRPGLRP